MPQFFSNRKIMSEICLNDFLIYESLSTQPFAKNGAIKASGKRQMNKWLLYLQKQSNTALKTPIIAIHKTPILNIEAGIIKCFGFRTSPKPSQVIRIAAKSMQTRKRNSKKEILLCCIVKDSISITGENIPAKYKINVPGKKRKTCFRIVSKVPFFGAQSLNFSLCK